MTFVGVDPGGRSTGVVIRAGHTFIGRELIQRDGAALFPDSSYILEVITAVRDAVEFVAGPTRVAIEGVVHPTGHVRMMNVSGLLGTAAVLGAVLGAFPDALVVPPGGHGSHGRTEYPAELWGAAEKTGTGKYRHLRSAWDVAGVGALMVRLEAVV